MKLNREPGRHRVLIVSNRLPITVRKEGGTLNFIQSVGGLATGLTSLYQSFNSVWIGWCGIPSNNLKREEKENIKTRLLKDFNSYPVFLSSEDVELYYEGFCNNTIWPLFHYFTNYTVYDERLWESYKHVNQLFLKTLSEVAKPDDIIWLHDYHLMLLPKLIRKKLPQVKMGFFLHIPFPSSETYSSMPWREEILKGLLGSDLVGFHTYDYVRHFLSSIRRILGYEHNMGNIYADDYIIKADAFPMGIDYEKFESALNEPRVQEEARIIRKRVGKQRIILSIDRLDYTKGILQRLEAFNLFLENNPQYREKVTLILCATPSRTGVKAYELLKKNLDELVGRINGRHGTIGWIPVWYLFQSSPFHTLIALYHLSDVTLVTPLRDGMNLIAKEFIATKSDGMGVLILSETAGAARELGEALIVNPNNKVQVSEAIKKALTMSKEEQKERNSEMQDRIRRYNVTKWAHDFIDKLFEVKELQEKYHAKRLSRKIRKELIDQYLGSSKRLILLDYDGTLTPFIKNPKKAKPDDNLLKLLKSLCEESKNEVVIISGRDKGTLEEWFSKMDIGLIAEHGVWIKRKNRPWEMIQPLRGDWKEEVRSILEVYVDRTPGSFLEEKEFSLVFNYRKTEPELALVRVGELKGALLGLTEYLNLGVLEGDKVVEIKNVAIDKGRAALQWISKEKWDFITAIGDDWTDEDVFGILPQSAYSIKVGLKPSQARFNLYSIRDVRSLLGELTRDDQLS
ncbi:MAG: bifunctional alpha,alpha-trehalose-phosphate synthase (UDP-forming)/trehalose-phosphatase [Candidatus Methanofastidiosia archaeon]